MKSLPKLYQKKEFEHADRRTLQRRVWRKIAIIALCISLIVANAAVALAAGFSDSESLVVSETEKTTEESDDIPRDKDTVYTLYLTHIFQFTSGGQGRSIEASETLELTEADFENGVCDLRRFTYDQAQLAVTEAKPLHIEDFDENREGGARIVYAVKRGWKVVRTENAAAKGSVLREVFNGQLADYAFVPAEVIRFQMEYRYSNTGGLAGSFAAEPDTVEAMPEKQEDGTYQVEWKLPTTAGFRIVLNPEPLNQYLVKPPTGNETAAELEAALERGDFNIDIEHHQVYYDQENDGQAHAVLNPIYGNQYSMEYNEAWDQARIFKTDGYTAAAMGEHDEPAGIGANPLVHPKLKVTLTEAQLVQALEGETDLHLTVYYRRSAVSYTVNHWVPKILSGLDDFADMELQTIDGVDYVRLHRETLQGRVGATTNAAAKTDDIYEKLTPMDFFQKLIESTSDSAGTTVDLYYKAADSYRVIFDTNYTYIPRQQVKLGKRVNFDHVTEPTRTGYAFGGWRYLKKDAQPDADGAYRDCDYEEVPLNADGSPELTINDALIAKAKLQASGGVLALHLYPKWTPEKTQVRVILWTEDLTGTDDVQAIAEGGNAEQAGSYYKEQYAGYQNEPKSHKPALGNVNAHYSNMGSFTMEVTTDTPLLKNGNEKKLVDAIQSQVTTEFGKTMGQEHGLDAAQFYSQEAFEIVHETQSGHGSDQNTASGDGKTMIYVYFTRNIYTLQFHYYGKGWQDYPYYVAINTGGFSKRGAKECVVNGELNFNFDPNGIYGNIKKRAAVNSHEEMPVPQTITIKAKYGADLQEVWPISRPEESVTAETKIAAVTSWAVTDGKFRTDALEPGNSHYNEFTIKGIYESMGAELIANPEDPGNVHHLVAYWRYNMSSNYYRYTHCYEVPALDISDMQKVSIYNGDTTNPQNMLYLVPVNHEAVAQYGFTDLMRVSYDQGQIVYHDPEGNYYAVREYTKNGETKYYAVARQVIAMSTNRIDKQVPSARPHLTRVNGNADHSIKYRDSDGANQYNRIGTAEDPYDLYFYYNRDRYQITYIAPINAANRGESEVTLGTIELPYGTLVTQEEYGFALKDADDNTNGYPWHIEADGYRGSVCPDRSENGTAAWKFKGWGLGPAGQNMQWSMTEYAELQQHAGEVFAIASNLHLYAIWEAPLYTVTFHLDGGKDAGRAQIALKVPENNRYSAIGLIPQPLREGYTLSGWYQADEDGTITAPKTEFDFDQAITENKNIAAAWSAVSAETFDYHIYYVTDRLRDEDKDKHHLTVQISDDKIVESGGKTYYVLEKSVKKDQLFIAGAALNQTAKMQTGYVAQVTNQILTLHNPDDTYHVIFYYDPVIARKYVMNFVEAGTEQTANPKIIKGMELEADQAVVTPQLAIVQELAAKGYVLVNKSADGIYSPADKAETLTWMDQDGSIKPIATLTGANIPAVVTYLVQPISYTIAYQNGPDAPSGAEYALEAVTAAKDVPVASAKGKNPTCYTVKDSFTIKNPQPVTENGKQYVFSHWSLGSDTTEKDHKTDFSVLKVEAGTMGNLTFVANWIEVPEGSDRPQTPEGSNPPNIPQEPMEPEPPVDIEDPDVPKDDQPSIDIEEPDVPKGDLPAIDLDEPEVPKAENAQTPNVPADTSVTDAPETGDSRPIWQYLWICILASGLAVLTQRKSQKKK